MRRNLLKQFMLTLSFFLLGGAEAWADIDFGNEEVVSEATTWTFSGYEVAAGKTETQNLSVNNKLYNRSASSGRGFYFDDLGETMNLHFSDVLQTQVSVNRIAKSKAFNNSHMNAKTAGTNDDETTPFFAFNTNVSGTCYALVKSDGSKQIRIFWGKADGTTALQSVNTTANTVTEIKLQADAGVFFIGGASTLGDGDNAREIYAIRFVPDMVVDAENTWTFGNFNPMTFNTGSIYNLQNGLYARAKGRSLAIAEQTDCSSWTFGDGHLESTLSNCITLGNLSNGTAGTYEPSENSTYKDGSIALKITVPGKIYVVVSGSDATKQIRIQQYNVTPQLEYSQSITTTPTEYSTKVEIGTVYIAATVADAKIYAIRFVPETVTTPTIRNNNGMITITPGVSSVDATVKTYYTTDGSEPTASSEEYTAPFTQATAATIKAITISQSSGATASDISEPKAVPTKPTALSANSVSFIGLETTAVSVDDDVNFTIDNTAKTYKPNSTNVSALYANGVVFSYTRGDATITLGTNHMTCNKGNLTITIPGLTDGQYVIVKSATNNSDPLTYTCTLGGDIVSGATTSTTQASSEANASTLVVNATGEDVVLTTAGAGLRLFSITIANTLTTAVADGQTEWGNASITTSPLVAETNYFTKGSSVTVTATPNEGYQFVNWKNGETTVSTEAAYTFDISENLNLTANFKKADLILTDGSGEHGTLSFKKGEDPVTVAQVGDEVTIVVAPATGYKLQEGTLAANYNDGEAKVAAINDNKFTMPAYPINVAATFEAISYNINYDLAGGTVESANPTSYTVETENFTLNNPTKAGCTFAGWKLNGEGDPLTTVTIAQGTTGNLSYTATWTTDTYSITLPASENGNSVTANKTTGIESGETITLTITTGTDYTLTGILANNGVTLSGTGNTRTFTMPAADVTIQANWDENTDVKENEKVIENITVNEGGTAAEISSIEVGENTTTIKIDGTVGEGSIPVTTIAANVFTAENTANVQSIDLSNTKVVLSGDVRESGVLSAIPENVIIVLPQESSSATGANVLTTSDGTNFTCSEVKIAEDKAFVNGVTNFTTKNFTFDRTFLNGDGQYNTVFLPVDIPAAVKTTLGTFYTCTSVNESGAVLTEVDGDLSANTAYIFKPASGKNKIEYTGDTELTVKVNANITNPTGAGLKGTNVEGTIATLATDATKAYGYAAETTDGATVGAFYKLKSTATVPAYRAWLEITGEAPSRLAIIIDGDDTTGIQSIDGIPVNEGVWYDIMGRKYTSKPTQKGVYILNGKKIYVK